MSETGFVRFKSTFHTVYRYYWSEDINIFDISKVLAYYLGVNPGPEERPGWLLRVCRALQTKGTLCVLFYNEFIGFPMLTYVSLGKDLLLTIEAVASIFVVANLISGNFFQIYRRHQLKSLEQAVEATRACSLKLAQRPAAILSSNRRQSQLLGRTFMFLMMLGTLLLATIPKLVYDRQFMSIVWYPFNARVYPLFALMLVATSVVHLQSIALTAVQIFVMAGLIMELSGQFRLLAYNLKSLNAKEGGGDGHEGEGQMNPDEKEGEKSQKKREALKTCVLHHYSILNLADEIKSGYNVDLFFVGMSLLVPNGLGIAYLANVEDFDARTLTFLLILVIGNILFAFIYWSLEKLADESEEIRMAVYESDWFDQSEDFKRSMRIIMSRCNQPVVFRAGGFVTFTMETYYNTVKLTYSYCMTALAHF